MLEGTVKERERLVVDGGEGKGKERRRRIFVQVGGGWRRGKGSGKESRDWLTAGLRQGPRFATGGVLSTKQPAAPTAY
jgi:hypothetical protein